MCSYWSNSLVSPLQQCVQVFQMKCNASKKSHVTFLCSDKVCLVSVNRNLKYAVFSFLLLAISQHVFLTGREERVQPASPLEVVSCGQRCQFTQFSSAERFLCIFVILEY
ncbi:hypothetical protein ILYODFUR_030189 [Ilyodon furcidens]|uniref:Uncharacterized protein n=1 Tax=Ilyodon furcidens TaxID=33524 RepID=A0ABV0SQE5_9TELE